MANIIRLGGGTGGGKAQPIFAETKIADDTAQAYTFTFTDDYHNYDFVKFKTGSTFYTGLIKEEEFFITTPSIIDHIFTLGQFTLNDFRTNVFCAYTQSGLTWTRHGNRALYIAEAYGVNCENYSVSETDIYKATARTTSEVAISSQTDLNTFDVILFAGNSNYNDELLPCWYSASIKPLSEQFQTVQKEFCVYQTDAFSQTIDDTYIEYNYRHNHYYGVSEVTISQNGMTAARYLYVLGIKFA